MSAKRRRFTRGFKLQIIREVEAGKRVAEVAREHELHPNLIRKWQQQVVTYAEQAFAGNGKAYTQEAKIAELERLIGQLTIENAFLKKVLIRLETQQAEGR